MQPLSVDASAGTLGSLSPQGRATRPPIPKVSVRPPGKPAESHPRGSLPTAAVTSSKDKGYFHLGRKEIPLAIEWFGKALEAAEKKNDLNEIREVLTGLGRVYLENREWVKAAKVFNAAYALTGEKDDTAKQLQLTWMEAVEKQFLEKECQKNPKISHDRYLAWRSQLHEARLVVQNKIDENHPAESILKEFSRDINALLERIILDGIALMGGKTPCPFTVVGLGSGGRQEMSPYSDLEFALLIKEATPETLPFFRTLVRWLELQVINLGETEYPILNRNPVSPTHAGFQFDKGGNTPLAKHIELIRTPSLLAELQGDRYYLEDVILSNTLKGAGFQLGDRDLFNSYVAAMRAILDTVTHPPLSRGKERALAMLKEHLKEFAPQIDDKKEEAPHFDVKAELYRLPSFIIGALADYYGIDAPNTWDKLEQLGKNHLSKQGVENLRKALSAIMHLRICSHLKYSRECDKVFHPSMQLKKDVELEKDVYILSDQEIAAIIEIYRVIFPLERVFKEVCRTGNFDLLAHERFYDDSLTVQGGANKKMFRFVEAKKCYTQALALNPDAIDAQLALGDLHYNLAEYDEAWKSAEQTLEWGTTRKNNGIVSLALNLQGLILNARGEPRKATDVFIKALKFCMEEAVFSDTRATIFNNLGANLTAEKDFKTAIKYYQDALLIHRKLHGNEHTSVIVTLNNLASAYQNSNDHKQARGYFDEALALAKKVHGAEHPAVATILNNRGTFCKEQDDLKQARACFEEALRIQRKVFGQKHPNTALSLINLGLLSSLEGKSQKAVDYLEEAQPIVKNRKGFDQERIRILMSLGNAWRILGKSKQAVSCLEEGLGLIKQLSKVENLELAHALGDLSAAYVASGDAKKAVAAATDSVRIKKKLLGEEHAEVIPSLNNLGDALQVSGNAAGASLKFEEALRICKKVHGPQHQELATTLGNIAVIYNTRGEPRKAITYHEQALDIEKKLGVNEIQVALCLNNIAAAYSTLREDKRAIALYQESIVIKRKVHGPDHPSLATSLSNMGVALSHIGKHKEALKLHVEAVAIDRKRGDFHPSLSCHLNNLGSTWCDLKKPDEAIKCFEEALKIDKQLQGDTHPDVATTLNNLGELYRRKKDYETAIVYLNQALILDKQNYGDTHPNVGIVLTNLGLAWKAMKNHEDAKENARNCFIEALIILEGAYGPSHPDAIDAKRNVEPFLTKEERKDVFGK